LGNPRSLDRAPSPGSIAECAARLRGKVGVTRSSAVDLKFLQFVCTHVKELQIQKPH
jgi:hypothetical protein